MNGRKRTVQVKFYVTEEERSLIEEKMKLPKVSACSSMKEAVQLALEHTKKDGVILAFGSLSYLKEIRQIMQSD